jgi:hypothetical protein
VRGREGAGGWGGGLQACLLKWTDERSANRTVRLSTLSLCFSVFSPPPFSFQYRNSSAPWPRGEGGSARRIPEPRGVVALPFLAQQPRGSAGRGSPPETRSSRGLDALSPRAASAGCESAARPKEQSIRVGLAERHGRTPASFEPPQRKQASPHPLTPKWRFGDS